MKLNVIKKNGRYEEWNREKIKRAIELAAHNQEWTTGIFEQLDEVVDKIEFHLKDKHAVRVEEIHETVLQVLYQYDKNVYSSYKGYRMLKVSNSYNAAMLESRNAILKIIDDGDNENANKESRENNTKHSLIGENIERTINSLFEMDPIWMKAHNEGYIHIHDLSSRLLRQHNCTIADVGNILKGGFTHQGVKYSEPGGVQKAMDIAGDIILSMSSDQYGGFTFPNVDEVFSYYANKTEEKAFKYFFEETKDHDIAKKLAEKQTIREIQQGWQSFETKLNTISNALGQIPFVTVSFGLGTSKYAQKITEEALRFRIRGLGENRVTAVFPKMVFLHKEEINGKPGTPNYHLKSLAIKCSTTRLYPDWLSGDYGFQKEVYDETGEMITPMGCRSFIDKAYNPKTGKMITKGRGNIGVVTINLPMIALEVKRSSLPSDTDEELMDKFCSKISDFMEMIYDIHYYYYDKIGKAKGSSNPLLYCEGGAWRTVGYDEEIKPITDTWTASVGYIGLEEASQALFEKPLKDNLIFGETIVEFMEMSVLLQKAISGFAFSLYGTPAESLIERFQNLNKKKFGIIENVTDRKYMTNSFHQGVWQELIPYDKIDFESEMFHHTLGGRISYCEWPYGISTKILEQTLNYAMEKGLYWGVNIESSTCNDCGERGEFDDICPSCGSSDVTSVNRTCGYLSYSKIKGESRYNEGKKAEIKDRVDHVNFLK